MSYLSIPLMVFKLSAITLLFFCIHYEFFHFGGSSGKSSPPYLPFFVALLSLGGVFYFGSGLLYQIPKWIYSGLYLITCSTGMAISYLMKESSKK